MSILVSVDNVLVDTVFPCENTCCRLCSITMRRVMELNASRGAAAQEKITGSASNSQAIDSDAIKGILPNLTSPAVLDLQPHSGTQPEDLAALFPNLETLALGVCPYASQQVTMGWTGSEQEAELAADVASMSRDNASLGAAVVQPEVPGQQVLPQLLGTHSILLPRLR